MKFYDLTVSALVHTLSKCDYISDEDRFVFRQCTAMPDYLGVSIKIITIIFSIYVIFSSFSLFHRLSLDERVRIVVRLRNSRYYVFRNFIRFYETLTTFCVNSRKKWDS